MNLSKRRKNYKKKRKEEEINEIITVMLNNK